METPPQPEVFSFMERALEKRRKAGTLRRLLPMELMDGGRVRVGDRVLVNFSGNDYLGLSRDPLLLQRGEAFARRFGAGATASRLVCGNLSCTEEVEKKIARMKGFESALMLASGYQANLSLLAALCDRKTLIFSDRLNHNSLIQGARLSGGTIIRFRHNDLSHLEQLLSHGPEGLRKCIVTESVFSMDGDVPDLEGLSQLAARYQALLVVDEAHATGVLGDQGMGLVKPGMAHAVVGTFGKGAGVFGAYVAGSSLLKEYLVNEMGGFVFSTALPPSVMGMVDASLDRMAEMDAERKHLAALGDQLRHGLHSLDFYTGASCTQIVPVMVGEAKKALALSAHLEKEGFLGVAIRPPTVPEGKSRIRISLCALHSKEDVEGLIRAFSTFLQHTDIK
ncbi:8-amino-7-oxononanoate synthase [Desulfobotulus alkaliphilus]|uniref:8-amino-7-oxononanoate synthase n=1 Tax=Desulfobotulus alkaliphilus TaxID=622671 RepID=A0A562RQA3_9BACT|nr:8-amino-7-oxononanoate synthase [Desulfobotulus alkaliphilus]TWI71228.1 8-amino-7-oxononanoate synthase [Desulfobotulus alkaliphilus]